jgi:hypothetical protein
MTLDELHAKHCHTEPLGDRLDHLRFPQKQEIAEAAYEHGVTETLIALETTIQPLERCLNLCGYAFCRGDCEGLFMAMELDERQRCEDCSLGEDLVRAANEPPVEETPTEPAQDTEPDADSGN